MRLRPLGFALAGPLVIGLAGCAGNAPAPKGPSDEGGPPAAVASDEEYAAARARYDALDPGEAGRAPLRAGLLRYALEETRRALRSKRPDLAFDAWKGHALALFDADDLRALKDHAAVRAELAPLAAELEGALRPRGAADATLTALAVEVSCASDGGEAGKRWRELLAFLASDTSDAAYDGPGRTTDALEKVLAAWPSDGVVDELTRRYRSRIGHPTGATVGKGGLAGLAEALNTKEPSATDLIRVYLHGGRFEDARSAATSFKDLPGDDAPLRTILTRYLSPQATAKDALELAARAGRDNPDRTAALTVCRDAARRFPKAVEPPLCIGEVATERDQLQLALRSFERARALAPERREPWEMLAQLHQIHLVQLGADDRSTSALEAELPRVEEFHRQAKLRFPKEPLHVTIGGVLVEVARGFYNAGKIDRSVDYLRRSLAIEESAAAHEQLGLVLLKRGKPADAATELRRAESLLHGSLDDLRARPRIRREAGDALELAGDERAALSARERALSAFKDLLEALQKQSNRRSAEAQQDDAAEIYLDFGKTLYQLGDRDGAFKAIEASIDVQPERGGTYADAIAFLVTRGEVDEARDALHRALGREKVSEYLKVYCSLWILDLDRRAGQAEDPLARAFLGGVEGPKWYHELARWASGRESEEQLATKARTTPERAELAFYRAMRRLEQSKSDEAKTLWQEVVRSEMMAFFEFDMASYYLRHGAPVQPALRSRPRATSSVKLPDGSI